MLRIKIIISIIILSSAVVAQPANEKIRDLNEFKLNLSAASKNLQTIKSEFTQEKNLALLNEKVISKGRFLFKKQNKVRMEYVTPFSYLMVINGDRVMIRDQQKSSSFSARSNRLFTLINNIIIDCVQGTILENKQFTYEVFVTKSGYMIKLVPVKKELKEFFEHIHVYIHSSDYTVQKFDLVEPGGDNTLITFHNKEINAIIADSYFNVR